MVLLGRGASGGCQHLADSQRIRSCAYWFQAIFDHNSEFLQSRIKRKEAGSHHQARLESACLVDEVAAWVHSTAHDPELLPPDCGLSSLPLVACKSPATDAQLRPTSFSDCFRSRSSIHFRFLLHASNARQDAPPSFVPFTARSTADLTRSRAPRRVPEMDDGPASRLRPNGRRPSRVRRSGRIVSRGSRGRLSAGCVRECVARNS